MTDDVPLIILAASVTAIALLAYPVHRVLGNLVRRIARVVGRMVGK